MCVCFFSSHSFWTSSSLDVPAGVTQEEGHTGFLIHLLPAVRALIFLARILVDFSPTFYCLPKPLFLYGSMALLSSYFNFVLCTMYYIQRLMFYYVRWLCMVINISLEYNGGLLSPRHYTVDPRLLQLPDPINSGLTRWRMYGGFINGRRRGTREESRK